MTLLTSTICSCVIAGDDLVGAVVSVGPLGARVLREFTVQGFLSQSDAERSHTFSTLGRFDVLSVTCDGSWCSLRPMALTSRIWASAQQEVVHAVEGLFPIAADDALLGVIDRLREDGAASTDGYLVAVNKQQAQPWLTSIEHAAGRHIDRLLTPHMALMGAGFQHERNTFVREVQPSGIATTHHFRFGEVVELALSAQSGENTDGACVKTLALDANARQSTGAPESESITARQLAVGAALAPRVAPRRFAPLIGPVLTSRRRLLVPAAASVAAVAFVWASVSTSSARYEAAARALDQTREQRAEQLSTVERDRQRAEELTKLVRDDVLPEFNSWKSIMPELVAAQSAMPAGAFLYRVELTGTSLTLRGEAARASDILRRVEDTPEFSAARVIDAPIRIEERATEQFHIRADRARAATQPEGDL